MAASEYQLIVKQVEKLSPQEQLRLIQQVAENLLQRETKLQETQYLEFGTPLGVNFQLKRILNSPNIIRLRNS